MRFEHCVLYVCFSEGLCLLLEPGGSEFDISDYFSSTYNRNFRLPPLDFVDLLTIGQRQHQWVLHLSPTKGDNKRRATTDHKMAERFWNVLFLSLEGSFLQIRKSMQLFQLVRGFLQELLCGSEAFRRQPRRFSGAFATLPQQSYLFSSNYLPRR
ncbi:hypothetical protein QR680_004522 [Steinernema hermaphroditum]|uniref:Uncharacterized protein n=1 Tax=Steinernema hermaphroditum TaxID=289476 RepID=A0AA39HNZ6_9BILA|nr:hypothetical protein QR680_004522 [Steinernema hermaphroditum]